jgi:Tol biopolymer transport system component
MVVAVVSVADATLKLLPTPRWFHIGPIVWFGDGSGLALQVQEQDVGATQIWQFSYPRGEARRITSDLNSYAASLTATADLSALVAVQSEITSNIWIAPGGEVSNPRAITSRKNVRDGIAGLTWAPDGRVVYETNISGKQSVWMMNADGSDPKQLTDGTADDSLPEVTPDGRYLVFLSLRTGQSQVWRADVDGSNPLQLTREQMGTGTFCISPDGQWVVYSPFDGIWKVPVAGGTPIKLVEMPTVLAGYGQVSPDGKLLAYYFIDDQTKRPKISVNSFADGAPVKTFDMPGTSSPVFHFSHDGRALIYIDTHNGASNLWSQPLDGRAPRQISDFTSGLIYRFAYSRDDKQLALARGDVSRDAVMISESK